MYSLDFCLISSGVDTVSFESVLYVANILLKSSLFTPSTNFEAMLKFLLVVHSSGSLPFLKRSRSSRNRSIDSSSLCLLFLKSHHCLISLHSGTETVQIYFKDFVCSVTFLFLRGCPPDCVTLLSSFRLSCSRCSFNTSTQVSMQPSESSLNSFGFLKVFLDLPPPLSLESVFLVVNASSVMFIISQLLAHVNAWHQVLYSCVHLNSWVSSLSRGFPFCSRFGHHGP